MGGECNYTIGDKTLVVIQIESTLRITDLVYVKKLMLCTNSHCFNHCSPTIHVAMLIGEKEKQQSNDN